MKQCKCGFNYEKTEDLEIVNLVELKGIIKYYCPSCKAYKCTKKINNDVTNTKIEFIDTIYEDKKDVLWYGGLVCKIYYKDIIFNIVANGDVVGDIYKDGEEITHFKDKSNNGVFYNVIDSYLPEVKTDNQLYELLNSDLTTEEIKEKELTAVVLTNNNWWEAFVERIVDGKENEFIDSFTLDISDNLDECIDYIINGKDNLYNELLENLN